MWFRVFFITMCSKAVSIVCCWKTRSTQNLFKLSTLPSGYSVVQVRKQFIRQYLNSPHFTTMQLSVVSSSADIYSVLWELRLHNPTVYLPQKLTSHTFCCSSLFSCVPTRTGHCMFWAKFLQQITLKLEIFYKVIGTTFVNM